MKMSANKSSEDEDAFARGFHGIPDESRLRRMSFVELASLLSGCREGEPKFMVVEREMKKRLAKDQATVNRTNIMLGALIAGLFTIFGALIVHVIRAQALTPTGTTQQTQVASGKSVGAVSDEAIRRVDNCVCSRSAEGQQLEPWQLAWNDAEMLKKQFSHCVCQVHIDLKAVSDPKRYVTPGTVVK